MSGMQEWTEEVLEPYNTLFLCFSLCMLKIYDRVRKQFLQCRIEFFDTFYSKFQLVSTFSIWSKFCVEISFFCCDLSCKWVTCRSGCKRFWKSALHIIFHKRVDNFEMAQKACLILIWGALHANSYFHKILEEIVETDSVCILNFHEIYHPKQIPPWGYLLLLTC